MLEKFGANLLRVGFRLVDLVDGNDDRYAGGLGVIDGLDRLRHHAVVGGNHQHRNVGGLGAARAHRGERGVTGRVDEGDLLPALLDLIGTDMLGDAAGLARHHICVADSVEQRRLAVIDVAHDGDDRRARLQVLGLVLDVEQAFLNVGFRNTAHRVAEFRRDQLGGIRVKHVAGLHHLALLHEILDDVHRALGHAVGEFLDGDRLGQHHFAHDLLARLAVHGTLELLLAATHRRQRTAAAVLVGQRSGERELAATAVLLALGLDRLGRGNFGLDRAALDGSDATRLCLFFFLGSTRFSGRRATARLFLGAAARLCLGLKASLLVRLAAGGFLALAAAALFFLGATRGILGSALALLDLAHLGILQRATACIHLLGGELVQHHARARRRGGRRDRTGRRRLRLRRLWLGRARLQRHRGLRRFLLLARQGELALLGLDDDSLRPPVREVLTHRALLHAGAFQRQRLLRGHAQRLVVFGITHSISSAASS